MSGDRLKMERVSVTEQQISMLVPPYIDQHTTLKTKTSVQEMLRVTREVRTILGQFYIYSALTRTPSLSKAVSASAASDGVRVIIGSLMRTLIVSTAALFDDNPKTSNLPKLIKSSLTTDSQKAFNDFHAHNGSSSIGMEACNRLVNYRRKMSRSPLRQAVDRIKLVRNRVVAHFESEPDPVTNDMKATVRDYDYVIAAAAIITGESNIWMIGRKVNVPELRQILRNEARGFCDVLMHARTSDQR